ncbi:kelch-like ECH-associated protein 1B [Bactrocera dorsalis]|uniref:Kelch-like ECH-associated protein 1B n=1 Tax=Bactrocera dorsalis TaxID=27457 RepID=A0ABM3JX60_BACDO|nr:kelch-like ECH-associated protein 1B [Bactrocera dorsalis]
MQSTGARGVSAANCGEKTLLLACFKETLSDLYLLQYNKAENKWQEYASIEIDYKYYRTILKDDNILFIGGERNNEPPRSLTQIVRSWNIRNKTWQDLPAMGTARSSHCVVELDDKIYAIGGVKNCSDPLSSVERYTTSDGWKSVKSLNVGRYNANAVALNGKIYIIGGLGDHLLKSVECYNPDSDTWTSCPDMNEYHLVPAVAAHNGHIYVFGDYGNNKDTIERYNPQRKTWSNICPLNDEWGCKACVSLDNKLWAIDRNAVSVYDEENDRWEQKYSSPKIDIRSCFIVPADLLTSK